MIDWWSELNLTTSGGGSWLCIIALQGGGSLCHPSCIPHLSTLCSVDAACVYWPISVLWNNYIYFKRYQFPAHSRDIFSEANLWLSICICLSGMQCQWLLMNGTCTRIKWRKWSHFRRQWLISAPNWKCQPGVWGWFVTLIHGNWTLWRLTVDEGQGCLWAQVNPPRVGEYT